MPLTLCVPPYPHWLQCIQVSSMRIGLTTCRLYIFSVCASVHFIFLINPLVFITPPSSHTTKCSTWPPAPLPHPLCRYSWSLLVDPTHVCWEETWATVERGGDKPSSTEQRYSEGCKLICLTSPLCHCCSLCYVILSSTRWWCMFVLHCNQ